MTMAITILAALRRWYQTIRRLNDGLLHPGRHRRALARLRALAAPGHVLVVCHGNICRSPYLQAVLQRELPNATIASAGFLRAERPVPDHSRVVSAQRGFDLSAFRSTTITRSLAAAADLVIVMDVRQSRHVVRDMGVASQRVFIAGDLDPVPDQRRAIRDPWNQSLEVFEESFNRLDRCAMTLVAALNGARPRELERSARA